MLTWLGFGSSHRRGATGWTDQARPRWVIDTCQPDRAVDGKSPAGGADDVCHDAARLHYTLRGLDPDARTARCPVDHALDGPWPAAGHRRNARMYRVWKPSLAAGFITGKVGSPLSSGSKGMARICLRGLADAPPCPVVVYRDDGVEPHETLSVAIAQFRRLRAVTEDDRLAVPEQALDAFWQRRASREEVLAALGYARDGSRWAPWIDAVIATVGLVL